MFNLDAELLTTRKGCYIYNTTSNRISFFDKFLKNEEICCLIQKRRNKNEEKAFIYFLENGFLCNDYSEKYQEKIMNFQNDTFLFCDFSAVDNYNFLIQNLNRCEEPIDYILIRNFEFLDPIIFKSFLDELSLFSPKIVLEVCDIELFKKENWMWINNHEEKVYVLSNSQNLQEIAYTLKKRNCPVMIMANVLPTEEIKKAYFLFSSCNIDVQVCLFNNLHSFTEKISTQKACEIFNALVESAPKSSDKYTNINFWPIGVPNNDCHAQRKINLSLNQGDSITQRIVCDKNKSTCISLCKNCKYGYLCKYKCRILDLDECYIQKYLDTIL